MKKPDLAGVTTLSAAQAVTVNGGGDTQDMGKAAGRALAEALTCEPLVAYYSMFTDLWYGV